MNNLPPTVFVDIDGTLVKFEESIPGLVRKCKFYTNHMADVLPGSSEKLSEWHQKGIRIILVTGRPESMRELTIKQLTCVGMIWDQLIMGCGSGVRYLINDIPDVKTPKAWAININRNEGIGNLDLDKMVEGQWEQAYRETIDARAKVDKNEK